MTISGLSESRALKTDSETLWVRLTHFISFVQYAEKVEKALCTCSASSRVGTRTSAEVALSFADAWQRQKIAAMEE